MTIPKREVHATSANLAERYPQTFVLEKYHRPLKVGIAADLMGRGPARKSLAMLKLRSIGIRDYRVLEGRQRIGRIRLRRGAHAALTAELEQERNRSAALARDPEPAQPVIGARSTTERPAGSPIIDHEIAEQLRRSYRATTAQGNPEAARLMARASALLAQGSIGAARVVLEQAVKTGSTEATFALAQTYDPKVLATWKAYGTRGNAAKAYDLYARAYGGGIQAAKDRSQSTIISEGERKPASWFGREEAD